MLVKAEGAAPKLVGRRQLIFFCPAQILLFLSGVLCCLQAGETARVVGQHGVPAARHAEAASAHAAIQLLLQPELVAGPVLPCMALKKVGHATQKHALLTVLEHHHTLEHSTRHGTVLRQAQRMEAHVLACASETLLVLSHMQQWHIQCRH